MTSGNRSTNRQAWAPGRLVWSRVICVFGVCAFWAWALPRQAEALVISEIMYHSAAADDRPDEFIEIYNENIDPYDLSGYSLCNGVDFVFPRGTYLDGKTFLVVCADEAHIRAKYGIDNTIGNYIGSLSNGGERVTLCNTGGVEVTSVRFNDRGQWAAGADGTGHSLELRGPYRDNDDADSFRLSREIGGSPGEPNGPNFAAGGSLPEAVDGMDPQGFILSWLLLGPYNGSNCNLSASRMRNDWLTEGTNGPVRQDDEVWEDDQVVNTRYASAQSTGLHASGGGTPRIRREVSFSDTIDFQSYWSNIDFIMAHAIVYVDNVTGSNLIVDMGVASDDQINILVNGQHVHTNTACRGVGNSGQVQDVVQDVTLRPGKNVVMVKVFEHGGGWAFRARFHRRNSNTPITGIDQIQITTDVNEGMNFDGSGVPIHEPGDPDPDPDPAPNPGDIPDSEVIINEALLWSSGERWIEIYNRSGSSYDLSNHHITDDAADLDKVQLGGGLNIPSGGYLVLTEAQLGLDLSTAPPGEIGDRKFLALVDEAGTKVIDAYNFEPEFEDFSESRVPDGDDEFEGAADPTRGAANQMTVITDVIFNEIFYHPLDDDEDREFVELYNRGTQPVDMTGWEITRGVNFAFPPGTTIAPDEYLVVARNPERIESIYGLPNGSVFGPEQTEEAKGDYGVLRDGGERITLKDEMGRTANTLRLRDGGDWPRWADGLGASAEVIDPMQDNRYGMAWDASDDSHKAPVREFSYIGRHLGRGESEVHLLLTTRGITYVDDLQVIGGGLTNIDTPIIDDDETWRYFKGTTAPPNNWTDIAFNDNSWLSGQMPIGYGSDNPHNTVLGDMGGNYVTVFCRKEFTMTQAEINAIDDLVLEIKIDDGYYAYLNGDQVGSHKVNSPAHDASASSAGETETRTHTLDPNDLVVGTNVLCIQGHNAGTGSSDFSIIPKLVSRVVEVSEGANKVVNGHFNSSISGRYLIQGTHVRSGRSTIDPIDGSGSLKIVASGRGDNKVNRIETSNSGLTGNFTNGEDMQISFKSRWVIGAQTMVTHGDRHQMAKSHQLAVPENIGTPGAINSVTQRLIDASGVANTGPVIQEISQFPLIPGSGEDVTVFAKISDPDGVQNVRIRHSDNNPSASPSSRTMTHIGNNVYRGVIPARAMNTKVVFYITAEDGDGRDARYPADVETRTHPLLLNPNGATLDDQQYIIYRHTDLLPSTLYHSYRFWMTNNDENRLRNRMRQSNDLIYGTFCYGASDLYYLSKTRFSGSPFARGGIGGSYRLAMTRNRDLHDRYGKMNLDNHHGNGRNANERISHYMIRHNQGAISVPYAKVQTMVQWQMNDATNNTLEHSQVPEGSDGEDWAGEGFLFEVDDRFDFNDGGGRAGNTNANVRYPPPSQSNDGNGENKENYRWFFGLRSRNGTDDFSKLIEFARVMDPGVTNNSAFDQQIWDLCNVEAFLRIWAIRLNTDDWDQWSARRGKNCYIHFPDDAPAILFAWDTELTYGNIGANIIPDNPNQDFNPGSFSEVNRMFDNIKIKRMWYGILDEMVNGPNQTFDASYSGTFAQKLAAIGMANTGIAAPGGYIDRRADLIRPRLGNTNSTAFRITTNSGRNFSSDDFEETISGAGCSGICQILVNGEVYDTDFTSMTGWRINDIPLHPGANQLEFVAFKLNGDIAGTDSIVITNTNIEWDPPVLTAVDPDQELAGERVTLMGTEFHNGIQVFFGAREASGVVFDEFGPDPGVISCIVPPGTGTVDVRVENVDGKSSNTVSFTYLLPPPEFLRGDANGDGRFNISDPVRIVQYLFGGASIDCEDACDINDDEAIEITDAIFGLDFLYRGGPQPDGPYPSPGPDPAGDTLGCENQ